MAMLYRRGLDPLVPALFAGSLFGRVFLVFVNERLDIFSDKLAGHRSIHLFEQAEAFGLGAIAGGTFFLQTLVNYPALKLLGPHQPIVLVTNAAAVSWSAIAVHWYFSKVERDLRTARIGGLLFAMAPAGVAFSLFGLRDPLIFLAVTLAVVGCLVLYRRGVRRAPGMSALVAAASASLISLRPELLPFVLLVPMLLILMRVQEARAEADPSARSHRYLTLVMVAGVGLVVLAALYPYVVSQIGAAPATGPNELLTQHVRARYDRQFGGGGGSAILPPSIYYMLPAPLRPIPQTLGMFVIPAPWLLTSFDRFLAFTDTILILSLLWLWWRRRRLLDRASRRMSLALVLAFVFTMAGMGLVVINAGNAFRMRFPVSPYIFTAGLVALSVVRGRASSRPGLFSVPSGAAPGPRRLALPGGRR